MLKAPTAEIGDCLTWQLTECRSRFEFVFTKNDIPIYLPHKTQVTLLIDEPMASLLEREPGLYPATYYKGFIQLPRLFIEDNNSKFWLPLEEDLQLCGLKLYITYMPKSVSWLMKSHNLFFISGILLLALALLLRLLLEG